MDLGTNWLLVVREKGTQQATDYYYNTEVMSKGWKLHEDSGLQLTFPGAENYQWRRWVQEEVQGITG